MPDQCLLVLIATPELEESLVDWFLARPDCSGFSSQQIQGHSSSHGELSLAEQVVGHKKQLMFHVHTACDTARELVASLKSDFAGAGLHYWTMPLLEAGPIR